MSGFEESLVAHEPYTDALTPAMTIDTDSEALH